MDYIDWLNVGSIVMFFMILAPFLYAIFGQNDE
jgi:hypothetical protein